MDEARGMAPFTACLIDAPCSGLGTLRRHPELRWSMTPESITKMAETGSRMLSAAADIMGRNATIVYATCTLCKEEDEHVIERFLASSCGSGWEVEPFTPAELGEDFASCLTPQGFLLSLPAPDAPDGHFAARLRKR